MPEQQPSTEWEQIVNMARNLKRWGYALSAAGGAILKVDSQDETDMTPEEFWADRDDDQSLDVEVDFWGFTERTARLIDYLAERARLTPHRPFPEDVQEGVEAAREWLDRQYE